MSDAPASSAGAPAWITSDQLHLMHNRQMELFGGSMGVLNAGAIEAALHRPINKCSYDGADLAECAAAYLYGIVHAHGYLDGNKRTGLTAALSFVEANGLPVYVDPEEAFALAMSVARKEMTEAQVVRWFRNQAK